MDLKRLYQESELGWALIGWYDFPGTSRVLIAGQYSAACVALMQQIFQQVEFYECGRDYPAFAFDAVLVFGEMRSREECISFLVQVSHGNWLQPHGVLLWAADNRLGARFLCGDSRLDPQGNCYTRQEWQDIFQLAELTQPRFHYVMPDWHFPRNIYTDDYLPAENSLSRMDFIYVCPENIIRSEQDLVKDGIKNGIFPAIVNSFLMEWSRTITKDQQAMYVDLTADKGHKASALICYMNRKVCKKPLFPKGSVAAIYKNGERLRSHGIAVIAQKYQERCIWMPYIHAPLMSDVLFSKAKESSAGFFSLLEQWWQYILRSSAIVAGKCDFPIDLPGECGPILAKAYLDFIPSNCFFYQGKFLIFDQEYVCANYPAKFVLYRGVIVLYGICPELRKYIPLPAVIEKYGLAPLWQAFQYVDSELFIKKLYFYTSCRREHQITYRVLLRNKRLLSQLSMVAFQDLFSDLGPKTLILFGAGHWCEKFLQEYGNHCHPRYIVDNNVKLWNQQKYGLEIRSPEVLRSEKKGGIRVIICSQYHETMASQLEQMGIKEYRVY